VTTPEEQLRIENQRRIDALREQLDQPTTYLTNEDRADHSLTAAARRDERYDDPDATDERADAAAT
jgi:hypothetical protein